MEHIIITQQPNGYVRLVAEAGYDLYNISTGLVYSEAVVKEAQAALFEAVAQQDN